MNRDEGTDESSLRSPRQSVVARLGLSGGGRRQ